jgi:hypothetical protein
LTRTVLDVSYEPLGTRQLKGVTERIGIFRAVPLGSTAVPAPSIVNARTRARLANRSMATIAIVSAIAAILVAGVVLRGTYVNPGSSPTLIPSVTAAASTGSSPSAAPSSALSPAEADLLDRIPSIIRASCEPTPAGERTAKTIASLVCSPDPASADADRVWYEAFDPASRSALSPAFFGIVNEHAIPHGDCATSPTAYGDWSLPGAYAGQRLCYKDRDDHAWVAWTYDILRILVRAERLDGDGKALFKWSDTIAALLN